MSISPYRAPILVLFLLFSASSRFLAHLIAQQVQPPTISYEGQRVSSIEIAGRPDLDRRQFRELIAQPVHAPYRQELVDKTIAALRQAGKFQDVQIQVSPEADGLRLLFVVQPAYYIGMYRFGKAERVFAYTRLLQVANYQTQEPYTRGRVDEASSNLIEFFHQTGYFTATVEPKLETDAAHSLVNVSFDVNLRRHARFGNVQFTGTSADQTQRLLNSLHTLRARLHNAYIKPGKPYSLGKLQKATTYMQEILGRQNYLAGRVEHIASRYNLQTNCADVTFHVITGQRTTVQLQGAHIWKRTQKKLIPIFQENAVDADLVHEGAQDLQSYFQAKGYFDVKVNSRIEQQPTDTLIVYQIEKGKRGKVTAVDIKGNKNIDHDKLASHVQVAKGRFFSRGKFSQQLLLKSVKNLEDVYASAGYSQVKVTPNVVNQNGRLQITFQVEEGLQDVVDSFRIEGNSSLSEAQLAPKELNIKPGKPFSQPLMAKDRDQIIATYLDRGYLTANFRATARPLKSDPHKVDVVYTIYEGPQVRTTVVDTVGVVHTRPEIIGRNVPIATGRPLSETSLLKSESQLYTLGIFDWASVDPLAPITTQSDTEVVVKLHEAKKNTIAYGVGFEVINRGGSIPSGTIALPGLPPIGLPSSFRTSEKRFWGPRGSVQYARKNFRGRAQTLNLTIFAGRLDQRVNGNWQNPTFRNTSWSSLVLASVERSTENPIFTARLGEGGLQFQRFVDRKKTEGLFLRYNFRRTNLTNLLIPDLVPPQDRNVRLSTLSTSFIRDTRDNALDAHKGIYESFDIAVSPSAIGSNTNFARFLGQAAYYRAVRPKLIWANSLRLGLEEAFAGAHVPLSERFFSGGGSTLRGFPLNGAGPQRTIPACGDPANPATCTQIRVPIGGQQLVILNSEARFPMPLPVPFVNPNNLGGVVFYDGGNVYNSVGLQNFFSNYTNTIGFGVRYATPVGPVRLDIGHNLNPISGISSTQFFVTFGQAF